MSIPCYTYTVTQPIQLDSTGHFTAQATGGGFSTIKNTVQISGHVRGRTMTLTTQPADYTTNPFTLTYGAKAQASDIAACPG